MNGSKRHEHATGGFIKAISFDKNVKEENCLWNVSCFGCGLWWQIRSCIKAFKKIFQEANAYSFCPCFQIDLHILCAFLSKQVKWDCSQTLVLMLWICLQWVFSEAHKFTVVYSHFFSFGLSFCTFCSERLEWFLCFVDCIFCFVPFLMLSLASWLTC